MRRAIRSYLRRRAEARHVTALDALVPVAIFAVWCALCWRAVLGREGIGPHDVLLMAARWAGGNEGRITQAIDPGARLVVLAGLLAAVVLGVAAWSILDAVAVARRPPDPESRRKDGPDEDAA